MTVYDKHRCAWGPRCVNRDMVHRHPETGDPQGGMIIDGPLCDGCLEKLRRAIKGLPRDWRRLHEGIGERRPSQGARVAMTRELTIPINTRREALQQRIVELSDRAVEMVEQALNLDGKQRHGRLGFPAHEKATVERAVKVLEPNLAVLLAQQEQAMVRWAPVPDGDDGWASTGQPRELTEMDGVEVALAIADVSRAVYLEMGLERLRAHDNGECPQCHAHAVGRWDGTTTYDCTACGSWWQEHEYEWLQGLITDAQKERVQMDILKWLLAEAYWRLDQLRSGTERVKEDAAKPGADAARLGLQLADVVVLALTEGPEPHRAPEDRRASTVKESA
ncbi:Uncharacterised protein [Mycobacteroides abscessus subsp. massiliense]|uniref:hypothetical protein n=1 Tax=Mycobacteroides abscessus TaxID=36809 RepID=UPI0009CD0324|nr:hypothetical protein [Mycobacteroides abscessus]SKM81682.1 Uncharacterised protein [Mycobacteroides abscessus subsp. massiliense]SKM98299.1 Uncharacterised protein [Mycobacteroides abscessus subsp. massiliense]SKN77014.1 Uncharacterised protein [Mycobacteroides abscessus subsp. massiliense]SKN96095.1 Uncharacterised protein [Mycobacteroides abscessus subsp. massiliense]SKO21775.1 Uncharacterised protein [Mycobacteroides abscessus subsp. massiliense]